MAHLFLFDSINKSPQQSGYTSSLFAYQKKMLLIRGVSATPYLPSFDRKGVQKRGCCTRLKSLRTTPPFMCYKVKDSTDNLRDNTHHIPVCNLLQITRTVAAFFQYIKEVRHIRSTGEIITDHICIGER